MKKLLIFMVGLFGLSYAQKVPAALKTGFSKEALKQNWKMKMEKQLLSSKFWISIKEKF
jgi:hypothetical protein